MRLRPSAKAVELDPKYAPAWPGVAKASFHVGEAVGWHLESRENDFARTLAAADKAIELGPDLADGYAARGYVRVLKTTDWAGAQADLARALALSPAMPMRLALKATCSRRWVASRKRSRPCAGPRVGPAFDACCVEARLAPSRCRPRGGGTRDRPPYAGAAQEDEPATGLSVKARAAGGDRRRRRLIVPHWGVV